MEVWFERLCAPMWYKKISKNFKKFQNVELAGDTQRAVIISTKFVFSHLPTLIFIPFEWKRFYWSWWSLSCLPYWNPTRVFRKHAPNANRHLRFPFFQIKQFALWWRSKSNRVWVHKNIFYIWKNSWSKWSKMSTYKKHFLVISLVKTTR